MDDDLSQDICRVCRCEATSERPLFYPCICTGSIKYIHQDCLMQWMRYSHKQYCELCGHRFRFQPIYSPDMPRVLPIRDVLGGLISAVVQATKSWLHYSLVGLSWFGLVPLIAYRTYRNLFSVHSLDMLFSLRLEFFSTESLTSDAFRGCFVVTCTLLSFIGLVWLREQILHGGGPDWLEHEEAAPVAAEVDVAEVLEPAAAPAAFVAEAPADQPMINAEEAAVPVAADGVDGGARRVGAAAAAGIDRVHAAFRAVAPDIDNDNEEPNWNPMEWERAAEELTWERLLGLDGSLVFLEYVFWIISLNTVFIFTFAFCPYCIGTFILNSMDMMQPDKPLLHFHGILTTLFGYCVLGLTLVVLHSFARMFRLRRIRWLVGFCYIVVKVSLLSVVEIGVLPLICGWWLDICSLPLFDATLKDRKASFRAAPATSLFVHWMFGMVYVYYFAAFISLLREVLRPGVLWFLRNLNDPDFSPIQEMIHLPILRHVRRLVASAMIFGSAVMLMFWLPIRILKFIWPTFLPYTLSGDAEVNELSLQLLLLQVILPGFFEQSHTRVWLKGLLRIWCKSVSWILGIKSYLLGTDPTQATEAENEAATTEPAVEPAAEVENEVEDNMEEEVAENTALINAAAPAIEVDIVPPPIQEEAPPAIPAAGNDDELLRETHMAFQPYTRPSFFALRLCALMCFFCISLIIASLVTLIVPVWLGRQIMTIWSVGGLITSPSPVVQHVADTPEVSSRPHELYSAALGTYLCWILSRAIGIAVNLVPLGRAAIMDKVKQWVQVAASYALPVFIFICLLSIIPLLFGLLLELVVVIPLRVSWYQTPVHFLWQYWALGVLYTKIAIALTLMGPEWRMRRALERAYRDGLRDIDLKFLISDLAAPIVVSLGLALAVPYVLAHSLVPLFVENPDALLTISRAIYPFCFVVLTAIGYVYFEINQFKKLYAAIKVDKYLVGQRLVNYVDNKRKQEADAAAAAAAALRASATTVESQTNSTTNLAEMRDERATGSVPVEAIKEPTPLEPTNLNAVELEMLEMMRRDGNTLIYRPQNNERQREVGFGNELL